MRRSANSILHIAFLYIYDIGSQLAFEQPELLQPELPELLQSQQLKLLRPEQPGLLQLKQPGFLQAEQLGLLQPGQTKQPELVQPEKLPLAIEELKENGRR